MNIVRDQFKLISCCWLESLDDFKGKMCEELIPLPDKWTILLTYLIPVFPENTQKNPKTYTYEPQIQSKLLNDNMRLQLSHAFFLFEVVSHQWKPTSLSNPYLLLRSSSPRLSRNNVFLPSSQPSLRSPYCLSPRPTWECRSTNILQCFAVYSKQHRAHLISHNPLLLLCVI